MNQKKNDTYIDGKIAHVNNNIGVSSQFNLFNQFTEYASGKIEMLNRHCNIYQHQVIHFSRKTALI